MIVPPFPPLFIPFAPFAVIVPVVDVETVTVPPVAPFDVALTTIALVVAFCIVTFPAYDVVVPVTVMFLRVIVCPLPTKSPFTMNPVPSTVESVVCILPYSFVSTVAVQELAVDDAR